MRAGEERKLVTVLFADLVGSTAYAGERDPERVRAQLEPFYQAMREEIELTGGTVEKFAGDAVMAVFGAPAALEDHAERALHTGLAMQRRMRDLFDGQLRLRVGVNTGDVVVELVQPGTSVEPFALRALGVARRDDAMLARADELFATLGLEWHRAQTERLLGGA